MHGYINEITSQIYINKWYQTGPFDFFQQTLLDECWLGSKPYKHMIFQMLLDNGPSAVTLFRPCKCPPPVWSSAHSLYPKLEHCKGVGEWFHCILHGVIQIQKNILGGSKTQCWVKSHFSYCSFDQARWQVMNSCASARAWMMAIEYVGWVVDGWTADSSRTLTINGT